MLWDTWKKGFDAWENATAKQIETIMKNPMILGSSGALLSGVMKVKLAKDSATERLWSLVGLPTKRDQERALHTLNRLESRLMDLEERLDRESKQP
ncbi:MAG: hypothetical protein ABIP39_06230 [Polyangiaceae bacterium]